MVTMKHPGEILAKQYLEPHGISAQALADAIGVPGNRITDIIRGRRGISADTAIRLGIYFGTTPQLWMHFQTEYDLWMARS
jgi:addiction module HigA family antidote